MELTKKAKLERFDSLQREHDLLQRYFWDTCEGLPAIARASYVTKDKDKFSAAVYGADRADGGYVVIKCSPGVPSIAYWEQWQAQVHAMPFGSEFALAMKSLGELLRRNMPAHHPANVHSVYPKSDVEVPRAW